MGVAQLSSVLKRAGHNTDLLVLDRKYKNKNFTFIRDKLNSKEFDVVGFTSVYSEFEFIKSLASYVKSHFNVFTVLGGVHVTLCPEDGYLNLFDALCIGEGENAILQLVDNLEHSTDISSINGLWLKKDNRIIKNAPNEFIKDLDSLPFVDRDLWQNHLLNPCTRLTLLLGRGCPYNCTYCCNHKLKKIQTGKYVRMRSVENIITEIKHLTIKFPNISEYFLEVETLGADINWLVKLCDQLYLLNKTREEKLKFGTNLRIYDTMDVDFVFSNLQRANFESVTIGLESGNERIRNEVMNRHYSNNTIIKAVTSAKTHKLKVGIFNLIGLPTESYEDFKDTLELNQLLQPNWHATSIFFPYKGTKLYDLAEQSGLLPEKLDFDNERQKAVLNLENFSKKQIQNQFDSFHYNVYKFSNNKSFLKGILYFIQKSLGHNIMVKTKNRIINIMYKFKIKNGLVEIIQKK